jgi:integrase/recombinase XerC
MMANQATDWSKTTPADLLASHLARPKQTARAYRYDLVALGNFLGMVDIDQTDADSLAGVVEAAVSSTRGIAQRTLDRYVATMRADRTPVNTLRRRIASTLSLLELAHRYDVITWSIKRPPLPASVPVKDTAGPGRAVIMAMLSICKSRDDAKGARDEAIMSLLYYQALRREEVISIRHRDYSPDNQTVSIEAKGKAERVKIPLAESTVDAIEQWLQIRGDHKGSMFTSCSRSIRKHSPKTPLTSDGLYKAIVDLGDRAGAKTHPHGVRHTATTEILQLTNGNIQMAMALTRHTNPATLMYYDDAIANMHRRAAIILDHGRPVNSRPSRSYR